MISRPAMPTVPPHRGAFRARRDWLITTLATSITVLTAAIAILVAAGPEGPPVGRHGRHRGSRNHGMPSSTQTRKERILTAPSRWIGRLTPRPRPEMRPSA